MTSTTQTTITYDEWIQQHQQSITHLGGWIRELFNYVPVHSYADSFKALFQYANEKSTPEEKEAIITELIALGKSLDKVEAAVKQWSKQQRKESKLGVEIRILFNATDVWAKAIENNDVPRELRASLKRKRDRIRALIRFEISKTEDVSKVESLFKTRSRPPSPSTGSSELDIFNFNDSWPKITDGALQGVRLTMEDKHYVGRLKNHKDVLMAGVFDGHGGRGAADYCADSLHTTIDKHLGDASPNLAKAEEALKASFIETDQTYIKDNPKETSGSTVVVALFDTKTYDLVIANAGDAECIISVAGQARTLSKRHKPEDPEEKTRIKEAGHAVVFGRIDASLAVSRAIGDSEFKIMSPEEKDLLPEQLACTPVPTVSRLQLGDDAEFFLLACDGLFDVCKAQEVVDWVRSKFSLKDLPKDAKRTDFSKFPIPATPSTNSSSSSSSNSSVPSSSSSSSCSSSSSSSSTSSPMEVEETPKMINLGDGKVISGLAESLCQHAVSKRSQDNVSCLIVFLGKD